MADRQRAAPARAPRPTQPATARPAAPAHAEAPTPAAEAMAFRERLGPGAPLEGGVRERMERGFGRPLGEVRMHTDAAAGTLVRGERAHAVAVGGHVAFAPGLYRPGTLAGDALLAHELAHTLQQRGGGGGRGHGAMEAEADAAAAQVLQGGTAVVGGGAGLRLQRCDDNKPAPPVPTGSGSAKAPPAGSTATPQAQQPPPVQPATPTQSVAGVKSLEIEGQEKNVRGSFWKAVQSKSTQRDTQIADNLGLVKAGSPEETMLKAMQGRFAAVKTAIADPNFDPAVTALPWAVTGAKELTDDQADKGSATLSAKKFRFLRGAVDEFRTALRDLERQRTKLDEERVEFKRFDDVFVGATTSTDPAVAAAAADAAKLLAVLATHGLTAADVKALMATETGDFTNTAIAGITGKSKGITTNVNSAGPDVVGIAQIKTAGRDEAIKLAAGAGVTISTKTDPRLEALPSILLAMAYMAKVAEVLKSGLPKPVPTGDEFKKLVYAGYNGGPYAVIAAAKSAKKSPYGWDDIKGQADVSGEMRGYVVRVRNRL